MNIIEVEGISKKYLISHQRQRNKYNALRDVIANKAKNIFTRSSEKDVRERLKEEFWALKDISFDVKQGDKIGIIGRNGAGKSTLLKILSRITEPTKGRIRIKGRVASLLEVGTGFHPELTGRENIYLNGSILGMRKEEIRRKFDEIVAFSEIEKFLDTPVKRYSSGMYVRLAFAVAAHLEPEILLVDEVLAVGDYEFQKKCLGKMEDVSKEGRTVVFISHNMNIISNLCNEAVLLEKGKIIEVGDTNTVIDIYTRQFKNKNYRKVKDNKSFTFIKILNSIDQRVFKSSDDILLTLEMEKFFNDEMNFHIDFAIHNSKDEIVIHSKSNYIKSANRIENRGIFYINYKVLSPKLKEGSYFLTIYLYRKNIVELWIENIEAFKIANTPCFGIVDYFEDLKSPIIPEFEIYLS